MTAENPGGDSKPEPGAAKGPDANEKSIAKGNNQDSGSGDATAPQQPGAAKPDAQGQPQQKPGSNSSSDAKPGAGEKGKTGTGEKGKTGAGEKGKTGAGEKGNSQSQADARKAAEEIGKLAQDLSSGDPQTRDEARRRLEEIRDAARDAQTRQEAQEALKQDQNATPQQGPKPGDQGNGKTPGAGEPTPKAGDPNGPPEPGAKGSGTPKAAANQKSGNPDARAGSSPKASSKSGQDKGAPSPSGTGRDPAQADPNTKEAGNTGTGAPTATRHSPGDASPAGPAEGEPGPAPNAAHASKSGELQLEDFKKVDKKLLDDLKMTEDDWKAFQKAYADRLQQKTAPTTGDQRRGSSTGRSAANTGPRRVQTGTDKQNPLERGSIIQPPAEYRDGYRGFTEDLSKSAPPPKKDQK
jgi:hypothetical protein